MNCLMSPNAFFREESENFRIFRERTKCENVAKFSRNGFPFRWKPLCVYPFIMIHMESSVVKNQIS